ncbi:MAG: hypothetical protein NVSMB45_01110 [Ginsengibacter sp.]
MASESTVADIYKRSENLSEKKFEQIEQELSKIPDPHKKLRYLIVKENDYLRELDPQNNDFTNKLKEGIIKNRKQNKLFEYFESDSDANDFEKSKKAWKRYYEKELKIDSDSNTSEFLGINKSFISLEYINLINFYDDPSLNTLQKLDAEVEILGYQILMDKIEYRISEVIETYGITREEAEEIMAIHGGKFLWKGAANELAHLFNNLENNDWIQYPIKGRSARKIAEVLLAHIEFENKQSHNPNYIAQLVAVNPPVSPDLKDTFKISKK